MKAERRTIPVVVAAIQFLAPYNTKLGGSYDGRVHIMVSMISYMPLLTPLFPYLDNEKEKDLRLIPRPRIITTTSNCVCRMQRVDDARTQQREYQERNQHGGTRAERQVHCTARSFEKLAQQVCRMQVLPSPTPPMALWLSREDLCRR